MVSGPRGTAPRRLLAFGLDYLVIAAYVGVLTAVSLSLGGGGAPPATLAGKLAGHALAFTTLTMPVVLYFAVTEGLSGATLGKAALGLRVVGPHDQPLRLPRSLARNALKFGPWELAHVSIWYGPGRPFVDAPSALNWIGLVAALLLALVWLSGLWTDRTVYDRLSGTRVTVRGLGGSRER